MATRKGQNEEPVENAADFKDAEVIPGLEHLGRAIVDENGVPSGSPANFEALRGKSGESISETEKQKIIADLAAEFPDSER